MWARSSTTSGDGRGRRGRRTHMFEMNSERRAQNAERSASAWVCFLRSAFCVLRSYFMFESHFGLSAKPFGKTPDPSFLYESDQHKEALARLEYAVEEKELALLVGEIGSGKTTLSRALIDRLGDARPVVLLINPRLTPTQLLRSIATGLGLQPGRFRNDLLDQIHAKLFELYEGGREPVLIIDEAQLIPSKATFDEIRLLTNFQLDDQNLLSVLLIGQPELETRIDRLAYAPLRQRIGMRYRLGPLSLEETIEYIEHRVRVGGGARN